MNTDTNARHYMALTNIEGLERICHSLESDFQEELLAGGRALLILEDLSDNVEEIAALLNVYARFSQQFAMQLLDQAIYAGHFRVKAVRTGNPVQDEFTRRACQTLFDVRLN